MNWNGSYIKGLLLSQSKLIANTSSLVIQTIKASARLAILTYKAAGFLAKGACRHYPTCSDYALECLNRFSTRKAIFLILCRVFSCRPFGKKPFYDPVPDRGR